MAIIASLDRTSSSCDAAVSFSDCAIDSILALGRGSVRGTDMIVCRKASTSRLGLAGRDRISLIVSFEILSAVLPFPFKADGGRLLPGLLGDLLEDLATVVAAEGFPVRAVDLFFSPLL